MKTFFIEATTFYGIN